MMDVMQLNAVRIIAGKVAEQMMDETTLHQRRAALLGIKVSDIVVKVQDDKLDNKTEPALHRSLPRIIDELLEHEIIDG